MKKPLPSLSLDMSVVEKNRDVNQNNNNNNNNNNNKLNDKQCRSRWLVTLLLKILVLVCRDEWVEILLKGTQNTKPS